MEIKASAKHIRQSPRKVRLVVDLVRGKTASEALDQLQFINKRASGPIKKLINSAVASAKHNFELPVTNLYIKAITADDGPTLHRWMPRAHGRATPIRKRTSHINLILAEIKESKGIKPKAAKLEAPAKLEVQPKKSDGVLVKGEKEKRGERKIFSEEKGKKIIDPREEGKGKHTKIEGSSERGFVGKIFRRKSG
jgi:large subunit ribosomal protein L22